MSEQSHAHGALDYAVLQWLLYSSCPVMATVRRLTVKMMVHAAWIPGWYELDQPLEVGLDAEFVFWRVAPDYPHCSDRLVFYNTLWHEGDGVFGTGRVLTIRHPELGDIRKIDTRGLDYTITLMDGAELLVNAEEDPGRMFEGRPGNWTESKRIISDWHCDVIFPNCPHKANADEQSGERESPMTRALKSWFFRGGPVTAAVTWQ